jgi:hypothetical protein
LVNKTNEALAALQASQLSYEIAGLFVQHGGRDAANDTGVEAAKYEENFRDFIDGVRQEFGVPQLPVIFIQQLDNTEHSVSHDGWVLVCNAQAAVDAADPLATMILGDDISRLDDVHYDADGEITFGQRLANAYLGAPYEGSAKPATDGFETGNFTGGYEQWTAGSWTVSGDASVTTDNIPHFGTHHARLRSSTGDLIRSVDVTGLTNVKLRFWSKLNSFESGDKAYVKVSGDGTNWATLREFVDGEDTDFYQFHELEVPNLGNSLYVRFDAQANESTDYWYIDDVKVVGTTPGIIVSTTGDYDANGAVDGRDYNAWRASFGSNVSAGRGADGSANGVIDAADYVLWRKSAGTIQNASPRVAAGSTNPQGIADAPSGFEAASRLAGKIASPNTGVVGQIAPKPRPSHSPIVSLRGKDHIDLLLSEKHGPSARPCTFKLVNSLSESHEDVATDAAFAEYGTASDPTLDSVFALLATGKGRPRPETV